jgi:hypothetical protein
VRRICKHGITIKIPNRKWLVENGLKSSGRWDILYHMSIKTINKVKKMLNMLRGNG